MRLYRSLVYRELKLTRKRMIIMLILFLLIALLMMFPLFLSGGDLSAENSVETVVETLFFCGTIALTGGILAGTNNGLQKADISTGWKRYAFVLPPTAVQQALSDLLMKLCGILLFGLLTVLYTGIFSRFAGCNAMLHVLNIYLGTVSVVMLIDTAYSFIMMLARDKKQLGVVSAIAFVGAGVMLRVVGLFSDGSKQEAPAADDGALISDEAAQKALNAIGSCKTTGFLLAGLAIVCVLFFLAMWRSHERREP